MNELATETARLGDDDQIRALLAEVCGVTAMGFAAVARVTDTRWIACQVLDKIEFGLKPAEELELKTTICDEIRQSGEAVVIDYVTDNIQWRTHATPALYGFESYASFPVYLDDGSFFGTLCAIDPAPRQLDPTTIVPTMRVLALRAGALLSRRLQLA